MAKMSWDVSLKVPGSSLVFWEQLSWAGSRVLAVQSTVPKGGSQPGTRASPASVPVPQGVPRVGTAWLALLCTQRSALAGAWQELGGIGRI